MWGEDMTYHMRYMEHAGAHLAALKAARRELKNPMRMDAGGVSVHTRGHGSAVIRSVSLRIGSPFLSCGAKATSGAGATATYAATRNARTARARPFQRAMARWRK